MSAFSVEDDEDLVSDEDLTAEALAADPDAAIGDDAIPLSELLGARSDDDLIGSELLPGWYMPPAVVGGSRLLHGWRRRIVLLIVASFVLINAYGLCSTYGHVGFG